LLAIGPLGLTARGPEDHLSDSHELHALVEGDERAHMQALIPTPVTGPAGLRNSSTGGRGAKHNGFETGQIWL
jgi:hypothetical protein